jgi:probable phosphoglycerate mutase
MGQTLRTLIEPADVAIFSSPLGRTLHTAAIIAKALGVNKEIIADPRLKEVGMGAWDGLTGSEIDAGWPQARDGLGPHEWFFHSPDGETYALMAERLRTALQDIAGHKTATKIIVSHGVSGRILRGLYLGLEKDTALALEVPQDALFRLEGTSVERIACIE